ncbi:hypothetical protein C8R43DRAFT_1132605 [Mycena crocata]|nr:hypothetical protein C8R43DRAFT_1132605 [Mycena crocata]
MPRKSYPTLPETVSGVPQVPLDFFFASILPPVTDSVSQIESLLAKKGHIVKGHWKHLPPSSGSSGSHVHRGSGPDHITNLIHIFDAIVSIGASVSGRSPTTHLLCAPTNGPTANNYPSPDGQIELINTPIESEPRLATAVPWRLKTMRAPRESNDQELIWSCQDVLRDDPCRRFTYGVTLEDGNLRIWFFSRSDELVSSSFSISEVSTLIQLFLALAFATPEQLGYDTTMSHFIDEAGNPQLKLAVGETVYFTKRLLSDHRSDTTCGRTTRVWEAYREDDPNRTSVAIKDLWTSVDTLQEGVQLSELHERLRSLADPGTPHPPQHYFLTVLCHGYVPTSCGLDDHTLDVMSRGSTPPTGLPNHPRKHYRIVFKEVGISLYKLQTLSEVMRALADATRALRLLHELGLVHRDVSPGNILVVNGTGKLSDLESALPFRGPAVSPQLKESYVGTANFTAGEAAAAIYSYIYDTSPPSEAPPYVEQPPFRFNPFHDLESTLWIGIWVVLYHRQTQPAFKKLFDKYFPAEFSSLTLEYRMVAISCGFLLLDRSDPFASTMTTLHTLRRRLFKLYASFEETLANQPIFSEEDIPLDRSAFDQIHSICIAEYEKAAAQSEGVVLTSLDTAKRKVSGGTSPVSPEEPVPTSPSPDRPLKKHKTVSPKGPPAARSSGLGRRKRLGQNLPPTRRSSRLALRNKSSKENNKSCV